MNQGVVEETVTGKGWEGATSGITLKVAEMSENDVLDAEAGGMKGPGGLIGKLGKANSEVFMTQGI